MRFIEQIMVRHDFALQQSVGERRRANDRITGDSDRLGILLAFFRRFAAVRCIADHSARIGTGQRQRKRTAGVQRRFGEIRLRRISAIAGFAVRLSLGLFGEENAAGMVIALDASAGHVFALNARLKRIADYSVRIGQIQHFTARTDSERRVPVFAVRDGARCFDHAVAVCFKR